MEMVGAREVFNIPDDFEVGIIISESKTESIDAQR
jgi:hypothetical protein